MLFAYINWDKNLTKNLYAALEMYRTKQHVDKHVLSILHRLRDEKDVS